LSGEIKGVSGDGAEGTPTSVTITFVSKDHWEMVFGEAKISGERIK
jgi:hypothetical protein